MLFLIGITFPYILKKKYPSLFLLYEIKVILV